MTIEATITLENRAGDLQTITTRGSVLASAVWSACDIARSSGDQTWEPILVVSKP